MLFMALAFKGLGGTSLCSVELRVRLNNLVYDAFIEVSALTPITLFNEKPWLCIDLLGEGLSDL